MADVVFCKDCRFYECRDMEMFLYERCLSNPVTERSYLDERTVYARPRDKNAENDCAEFRLAPPELISSFVQRAKRYLSEILERTN